MSRSRKRSADQRTRRHSEAQCAALEEEAAAQALVGITRFSGGVFLHTPASQRTHHLTKYSGRYNGSITHKETSDG